MPASAGNETGGREAAKDTSVGQPAEVHVRESAERWGDAERAREYWEGTSKERRERTQEKHAQVESCSERAQVII